MKSTIKHTGKVKAVEGHNVYVQIEAQSGCGSCNAKSACGMTESDEKLICVDSSLPFIEGEDVVVIIEQSLGAKAVLLAYVIPFLLVLITLLILIELSLGELFSGLSALSMLGLYYMALFLLKDKISKEFNFILEKI